MPYGEALYRQHTTDVIMACANNMATPERTNGEPCADCRKSDVFRAVLLIQQRWRYYRHYLKPWKFVANWEGPRRASWLTVSSELVIQK